jgi:hypothetical protein
MRDYPEIGIQAADILLPGPGIDLYRWAVIACDQFTSQPEYWAGVRDLVGDSPSTFHMILPEVYLGTTEEQERIRSTQAAMRNYLDLGLLVPHTGFILVERTVDGKTRHGLMLALDLEQYDFSKGSQSLVRATEGTILDRLPPRIRIREGAALEIPHILILIDDPERTVIEPLVDARSSLQPLYQTGLMLGSGSLKGSLVVDPVQEQRVVQALRKLADPQRFRAHYGVGDEKGVLLFAAGDGNHSLATAKSIWEKIKAQAGPDHPARYALVEVENVHDEGLVFEPIHRVLFGVREDWQPAFTAYLKQIDPAAEATYGLCPGADEVIAAVQRGGDKQVFGAINPEGCTLVTVHHPPANLAVGTLQGFLDGWLKQGGANSIDYVHGSDVVRQLGTQAGNLGFYLPAMDKGDLFKTVILDGSLPRKTFSMGEAHEKRFYMEARRITA